MANGKIIVPAREVELIDPLKYQEFIIELDHLLRTGEIGDNVKADIFIQVFYSDKKRRVQRKPDHTLADEIEHPKEMVEGITRLIKPEYPTYRMYGETVARLHDCPEDSYKPDSLLIIRIGNNTKADFQNMGDKPHLYVSEYFSPPAPFMIHQLTRYEGESVDINCERLTDFNYFKKNFSKPDTDTRNRDINNERADFFIMTILLKMLDNKSNYSWGLPSRNLEESQYYLRKANTYLKLNQKISNFFLLYKGTSHNIFHEDKTFNEIETTIKLLENYAKKIRDELEIHRKVASLESSRPTILEAAFY